MNWTIAWTLWLLSPMALAEPLEPVETDAPEVEAPAPPDVEAPASPEAPDTTVPAPPPSPDTAAADLQVTPEDSQVGPADPPATPERSSLSASSRERDEERVGFLLGTVVYLPNRFLDFFDMFRFRFRVGPGIGVGIRATEWVDAYVGIYAAGYVGLPGPRNRKLLKLPFGIESQIGVEVSKVDLATGLFLFDPDYGEYEFGFDAQVLLMGGAVGFDPSELFDFVGGVFLVDPKGDDMGYPKKDKDEDEDE